MNSFFELNRLFIVLTISFVLGVVCFPISSILLALGVCTFLFLCLFLLKAKKLFWVVATLLLFLFGSVRKAIQIEDVKKKQRITIANKSTAKIEVLESLYSFNKTVVCKVKLYTNGNPATLAIAHVPENDSILKVGGTYLCQNKLSVLTAKQYPYPDRYFQFLKARHITHRVALIGSSLEVEKASLSLLTRIRRLNYRLVKNLDNYAWSPEVLGFLKAFVFGDRSGLSRDVKENFRNAGVMHILAISGLHIGMLYQLLMLLFRKLLYLYKYRWLKSILILLCIWSYIMLIGFPVAATRAAIMFSLFEFSKQLHRKQDPLDILCIYVFLAVFVDPIVVYEVGFQLSVVAVFFIIVGMRFWLNIWCPTNFWLMKFWQLLGVTLFAQIGLLPILIYYFHQFPLLFLIANIPLLFVLPVLFMLSLVVVCAAQVFNNNYLFFKFYECVVELMLDYVAWVAQFDFMVVKGLRINAFTVFLLYAGVLFLIFQMVSKRLRNWNFIVVCNAFLFLQIIETKVKSTQKELWVWEENQEIFLGDRYNRNMKLYSNFKKAVNKSHFLNNWLMISSIDSIEPVALQNSYALNKNSVLNVVDYPSIRVDSGAICIISKDIKINMNRLLLNKPKLVLLSSKLNWFRKELYKGTCKRHGIKVYDLRRVGGINISNL